MFPAFESSELHFFFLSVASLSLMDPPPGPCVRASESLLGWRKWKRFCWRSPDSCSSYKEKNNIKNLKLHNTQFEGGTSETTLSVKVVVWQFVFTAKNKKKTLDWSWETKGHVVLLLPCAISWTPLWRFACLFSSSGDKHLLLLPFCTCRDLHSRTVLLSDLLFSFHRRGCWYTTLLVHAS